MLTQPQMGDRHSFPCRPAQYISGYAMFKLFYGLSGESVLQQFLALPELILQVADLL
jgi:hypothetical protein